MTWPTLDAITTARCRLAPLTPTHAGAMVDVLADSRLYEFTGGTAPTLEQLRRRYGRQSLGWCNWIVTVRGEGRPVGYVQATVEQCGGLLAADVAWVIQPVDQSRGIATEAAQGMIGWLARHGVARYTAYIHPEHAASARVASKLGMYRTGSTQHGEARWESAGRSTPD